MKAPLLTAIVSTYNAQRFMQGCLDDLVQQTTFPDLEIIVIDSGSQQNEAAICAAYAQQYPNIKYVRTEREGLYTAWNRAVSMANGEFISSANTDDRHRDDAFEVLTKALKQNPSSPLAYGNQYKSLIANETFAECAARNCPIHEFPDFSTDQLLVGCITGSQPVWRKSLHQRMGLFDTRFTIAADWDLWLKCVQLGNFLHIKQTLGVFYSSPNNMSGAAHADQLLREDYEILRKNVVLPPWQRSKSARRLAAMRMIGIGYHFARANAMREARKYFFGAWKTDPMSLYTLRTLAVRGLLQLRPGLP